MFVFKKILQVVVPGFLIAALLLVIVFGGIQLIEHEVAAENAAFSEIEKVNASRFAAQLRAQIEQDLNQRLFTVVGMKGFVVENNYEVNEKNFQAFAKALVDDSAAIRSLQLAPDAIVTHIYPLEGNEAALGHNLLVDDVRRDSVLKAIDTNQYIITGPIELLQGGNALIARLPIYRALESPVPLGADQFTLENFWGFATVLVDVDVIYDVVSKNTQDGVYDVALRGTDGAGASGAVFYGEQDFFAHEPVLTDVQLPVGSWQIGVIPTDGWQASSPAAKYLFITGYLVIAVLLGLILFTVVYIRSKFIVATATVRGELSLFSFLRHNSLGFFLVLICVGLTALGLYFSQSVLSDIAETEFNNLADQAALDVVDRMKIYQHVLEGGEGLFAASDSVSRSEWKTYVDSLSLKDNYPGIQGIGYAVFVSPEYKEQHEQSVRSEGFPEFSIRPAGDREMYTSIIYLEPFDERNRQAFGFDMYQEANRNMAMRQARDTGVAAASRKITLVQEIDSDVQAGFLLYVPHYSSDSKPTTVQQRQESIAGFVYSPFRARDFIEGIIGETGIADIGLRVFDGAQRNDDLLLYDDFSKKFPQDHTGRFAKVIPVGVAGNTWLLEFESSKGFGVTSATNAIAYAIFALGLLVTLMLGLVFYVLSSSRGRAMLLATQMTNDYKLQRKRLESFHAIVTMPDVSLQQRIQNTLKIVTEELGLQTGIVSQIDGDLYTVRYAFTNTAAKLAPGDTFEFKKTYCELTMANDGLVAMHQVGQSEFSTHPAYQSLHLESYIGAPLRVNGQRFGTVNFSSAVPHPVFSEDDKTFMTLAVRWISRMIENQEVDRSKDEFVSLASHQLRTPLSIVNWYAEILQDESLGKLTIEQKDYLAEIAEGNRRMTELVNALLNVSRLDLGTFQVEPEEVVLKTMLLNIKKQYQEQMKGKKITWSQTIDTKVSIVQADKTILALLFDNLVSNAFKYTPAQGEIQVSVKVLPKNRFSFSVSDTGYGIPKNQQDKMFSKMFRADNVSTKDTVGSGLGLYMVKSIVEAVGGTISFESKENKGTTFVLQLPQKMEVRKGTSRLSK